MRSIWMPFLVIALVSSGCGRAVPEKAGAVVEEAAAELARARSELSKARAELENVRRELATLRAEVAIPTPQKGNLRDPDWRVASWVLEIGGRVVIFTGGNEIDVKKIDELGDRPFRVSQVWLPQNRIVDDAGLARFRGLKQIRFLDLFGTSISDAGLAHIQGLGSLLGLSLRETTITDSGLVSLKDLRSLKTLDLSGTQVTAAAIEAFREAVPECQVERAGK